MMAKLSRFLSVAIGLVILATGVSANAGAISGVIGDGVYGGQGLWNSPSQKGTYEVMTGVAGDVIETRYLLPDGSEKSWRIETIAQQKGFFQVKVYGRVVGQGYCLESAAVCHYEVQINDFKLEETFVFMDGKLYRYGSKSEGGELIVWQEMATRK